MRRLTFSICIAAALAASPAAAQAPIDGDWLKVDTGAHVLLKIPRYEHLKGQIVSKSGTRWPISGSFKRVGQKTVLTMRRQIPIAEWGNLPKKILRIAKRRWGKGRKRDTMLGKIDLIYDPLTDRLKGKYEIFRILFVTAEDKVISRKSVMVDFTLRRHYTATYGASRARLEGTDGENHIVVDLRYTGTIKCKNLCLASIFHVRDKNGEIVIPPKGAFLPDYTPPGGIAPHLNGYLVDAPIFKDGRPSKTPCMPSSKINGKTITAEDIPFFLEEGYTAHFETNLICIQDSPFTILGPSLRWTYTRGKTTIGRNGGTPDQPAATGEFRSTIEPWIAARR